MAYTISNPQAGWMPITAIDAGIVPANNFNTGSTATVPNPPMFSGMVVNAIDPVYGGGEFILLKGASNTTVGLMVTYSATSFVTTLSPNTAGIGNSFAWAMSANTDPTAWSWYQIGGLVVAKKTNVSWEPQKAVYQSGTIGRVMDTVASGKQVVGAVSANLTTVTTTTSTIVLQVNRPHNTGVII